MHDKEKAKKVTIAKFEALVSMLKAGCTYNQLCYTLHQRCGYCDEYEECVGCLVTKVDSVTGLSCMRRFTPEGLIKSDDLINDSDKIKFTEFMLAVVKNAEDNY